MVVLMITTLVGIFSSGNIKSTAASDRDVKSTPENLEKATFAGGCFWCMEAPFEKVDGVIQVISGYTGGHVAHPTYEQVSSGSTGHLESIQVTYDPGKVSYEKLLDIFWRQIDPTDAGGSFVDRGKQYRSAIFYNTEEQRRLAEESKKRLEESGRFDKPIETEILKLGEFYPAEDYHQYYYDKNPNQPYCMAVAGPKVAKIRAKYKEMLKD